MYLITETTESDFSTEKSKIFLKERLASPTRESIARCLSQASLIFVLLNTVSSAAVSGDVSIMSRTPSHSLVTSPQKTAAEGTNPTLQCSFIFSQFMIYVLRFKFFEVPFSVKVRRRTVSLSFDFALSVLPVYDAMSIKELHHITLRSIVSVALFRASGVRIVLSST